MVIKLLIIGVKRSNVDDNNSKEAYISYLPRQLLLCNQALC